MHKSMLFLCTGNYYRSRFAELLFNDLAARLELDWLASSRGLSLSLGRNNVGPISEHALLGLNLRGVTVEGNIRCPLAVRRSDLEKAHHVVAVNRPEHQPMLAREFPDYVERVEFWDVSDLGFTMPNIALGQLEKNVLGLINRLSMQHRHARLY
jgi:protein-tyrosine phosphatase